MSKDIDVDNIDDFLSLFGEGKTPKDNLTIEEEFYDKLTYGKVNKLGNIRYYLNAGELPKFQFLKEKGVSIQIEEEIETKPIVGAATTKLLKTKVKRDLTQEEFIKLSIEYYLLVHCLPYFMLEYQAPHRQACSMSVVVEMLANHPDIRELFHKKY